LASASSSRPPSVMNTPTKKKLGLPAKKSGSSTPIRGLSIDQRQLDLSGLNLTKDDNADNANEEPPKMGFAKEKLLEEARRAIDAEGENQKKAVSIVVIGMLVHNIIFSH
jgi:elongation factor 1 alpha-like protein